MENIAKHLEKICDWFDAGCHINDEAQIMIIEAQEALKQSRQAAVSGSLPLPKKLVKLVGDLRRGCDCGYDDRCSNCQTIIDVKELVKTGGNDR